MEHNQTFTLTRRDREIIHELAQGLYYKEIASKAFISPETVKQHLKNIYRKMGVRNRMEATQLFNISMRQTA